MVWNTAARNFTLIPSKHRKTFPFRHIPSFLFILYSCRLPISFTLSLPVPVFFSLNFVLCSVFLPKKQRMYFRGRHWKEWFLKLSADGSILSAVETPQGEWNSETPLIIGSIPQSTQKWKRKFSRKLRHISHYWVTRQIWSKKGGKMWLKKAGKYCQTRSRNEPEVSLVKFDRRL